MLQQGKSPTDIGFVVGSSGVEGDAFVIGVVICIEIDTASMTGEFRNTEVVVWYHVAAIVVVHKKDAFTMDLCVEIQLLVVRKANPLELQLLLSIIFR